MPIRVEKASQGARLFGLSLVAAIVIIVAMVVGTNHRSKNEVKAGCQQIAAKQIDYASAKMIGEVALYQRQNALLADCREKGFID